MIERGTVRPKTPLLRVPPAPIRRANPFTFQHPVKTAAQYPLLDDKCPKQAVIGLFGAWVSPERKWDDPMPKRPGPEYACPTAPGCDGPLSRRCDQHSGRGRSPVREQGTGAPGHVQLLAAPIGRASHLCLEAIRMATGVATHPNDLAEAPLAGKSGRCLAAPSQQLRRIELSLPCGERSRPERRPR